MPSHTILSPLPKSTSYSSRVYCNKTSNTILAAQQSLQWRKGRFSQGAATSASETANYLEGFKLYLWKQGSPPISFSRKIVAQDTSKGCQVPSHQCSDVLCWRLCITLSFPFTPRTSPAAQELQIKIKALTDSKSSYLPASGSNSALASHRHQVTPPTVCLSQEEWLWDMEYQWLLSQ